MNRLWMFWVVVLSLAIPTPARAWHNRGHNAVARIAWQRLVELGLDRQAIDILDSHPHRDLFLLAGTPEGVERDEWMFVQAATWAEESLTLAKSVVYQDDGRFLKAQVLPDRYQKTMLDNLQAPVVSEQYQKLADKTAQRRLVLAGYRLGDVLATALQKISK